MLNDTFYIHGGIDYNDITMKDFAAICLNQLVWHEVVLSKLDAKIVIKALS